jgi:hypothetical protein
VGGFKPSCSPHGCWRDQPHEISAGSSAARLGVGECAPRVGIGRLQAIQWDPVRRGIAWMCMCGATRVVGHTRSGGSTAARSTCGPACAGKNPLGFRATLRCSTLSPKGRRLGRSSPAARVYGGDVNRTTTRSDRFQDSLGQGKEQHMAGHRHTMSRHGTTRRLGTRRLAARRWRSRGRGRMGASRCPARSRERQAELPALKIEAFDLLLEHARRLGHGGAWVRVPGGGKKTRLTWLAATHERTRPCRRRGRTEGPKGFTFPSCPRRHHGIPRGKSHGGTASRTVRPPATR